MNKTNYFISIQKKWKQSNHVFSRVTSCTAFFSYFCQIFFLFKNLLETLYISEIKQKEVREKEARSVATEGGGDEIPMLLDSRSNWQTSSFLGKKKRERLDNGKQKK